MGVILGVEAEYMRACMRKLAIWHSPKLNPITTTDQLDLIMSTLGFFPLPFPSNSTSIWKEYSFPGAGAYHHLLLQWNNSDFTADYSFQQPPPPRPRLPYPRIDGLHVDTYRAFLEAVNFYLRMDDISLLFHIRGMPLERSLDRSERWCQMVEGNLVYVYREGTLDQSAHNSSQARRNDKSNRAGSGRNSILLHNKDQNPVLRMVPWENIIVKTL